MRIVVVQLLSPVQPCDSMDCSMPVLHYLPAFAQVHIHWVGDIIQLSHPLPPSSPFAFSLSQHHGLFPTSQFFAPAGQSIGASASVLPMNIQGWSPLGLTGLISLQSKGLSSIFSNTTVQKHQIFSTQPCFMVQLSHLYMTTGKTISSVSSVAQSCPTLRSHEPQHTRPPCPSPTPGIHSDSRPSSQWCHLAISSSVVPFSSCPH